MPIRDADTFAVCHAPAGDAESGDAAGPRTFANRGASGIDGTVATAHGVARGLGEPVVLLIGDLALVHDQTSLMLLRPDAPQPGPPVVVVVVNNDGGGIFHFLPVARGAHPLDADAVRGGDGGSARPDLRACRRPDGPALPRPRRPPTPSRRPSPPRSPRAPRPSIEVATDRTDNEALHARLTRAAATAADGVGAD